MVHYDRTGLSLKYHRIGCAAVLGQQPPGTTAELFTPGLVAADESLGCSGFLDDGKVFVFSSMKKGTDWRFEPTYVTRQKRGRCCIIGFVV